MMKSITSLVKGLLSVALFFSTPTGAKVPAQINPVVTLSSDHFIRASRWMFEPGAPPPKLPAGPAALVQMRQGQSQQNFQLCMRATQQAFKSARIVAAWIANSALICAMDGLRNGKLKTDFLRTTLARIEKTPEWSLIGPQKKQLHANFLRGSLLLIESDLKLNRRLAWEGVENLSKYEQDLNPEEKAELYRFAGEILFVEQDLPAAQAYFQRSLLAKPSKIVRERLQTFKAAMPEEADDGEKVEKKNREVVRDVDASNEEMDLVTRITASLKTGDLLSAVEDAAKLAHGYPGSSRKQWANDRVLESFFNILGKADKQYEEVKSRYFRLMLRFDDETVFEWAKKLFARGYYAESGKLAQKAISGMDGMAKGTAVIFLAARSALYTDNFSEAEQLFQTLQDRYAGTTESIEAVFQLGLLQFRKKSYSRAAGYFERLLVLPKAENWELSARYWLWRSLQLEESPRAVEQSQILQQKFPFSYYGLRAQIDSGNVLAYKWEPKKTTIKMWLTQTQQETLKRVDLLLQGGWWDEAQQELKTLPLPTDPESKAILALYYAQAMDFSRSTALINDAWDEDPSFRNPPFIATAFPTEFTAAIAKEAKADRMNPSLVRALIKQESAFGVHAVSSSGALGLMQLIPPTAQEVAGQLGIKNLKVPEDMFQYETNIRMGSYYLASMLDRYQNHVPLALAAYNAGPYRMDSWMRARPSLKDLKTRRSSTPMDELWIEELPWSETRQYIKAILRNCLLYKILEEGRAQVSEPIWGDFVKERLEAP